MYYFSAKSLSFYPGSLKDLYENWPEDAVGIENSDYLTFKGMPPEGKTLGANEEGYPSWKDKVLSVEDRIEICSSRISWVLGKIPLYSSPVNLGIATEEEAERNKSAQIYLVELSRCKESLEAQGEGVIPEIPDFLNN